MKKFKFLALILMFAMFLISGCTFDDGLKLEKSTLTASEFYANVLYNQSDSVVGFGNLNIPSSEQEVFNTVVNNLMSNEYDFLAVVCAMDFHIELSKSAGNAEKLKIYEIKDTSFNVVVMVNKVTSEKYEITVYLTNEAVTNLENVEPTFLADLNLEDVSKNINYSLTYKKYKNVVKDKEFTSNPVEFTYNYDQGSMKIKLTTTAENFENTITREIYDYRGDICSVRTISSAKVASVALDDCMIEMLKSPYLIRSKIGELKNKTEIPELSKISQENLAIGREEDDWCYVLNAKASEEGGKLKWLTSFNKFGIVK